MRRGASDLGSATARFARAFADHAGRRLPGAVALVAGGALLEGVGILALLPILDAVMGRGRGATSAWLARAGVATPLAQLAVLLTGFLIVMGLRALLLHRRDVTLADLQASFVEALRNRVMRALAATSWERVVALSHARVVNMMGAEFARVAASANFLVQGAVALAMLAIQAALAFVLAPWIALGAAALLGAGGLVLLLSGTRVHDLGGRVMRSNEALVASTTGFLGGLKAAAAENAQGLFVAEFARVQRTLRADALAFIGHQARSRFRFAMGSAVAGAGVLLAGVAVGTAPGVLITLVVVFARMSGPAQTVQAALQNLFFGLPSFEAAQALVAELGDAAGAVAPAPPPRGAIELCGAAHRHAGGGGIVEATLTIAPGEFVGLSGPSGAGKTSLVDLLAGLVAPDAGELRVGGVALDAAGRAGWRQCVGYVAQDDFLFHDSIRRNLSWGREVADADVAQVLAVTGLDTLVARLGNGLDAIVGERGARLSGGERQRIGIARALLRRPRLLVLDEATAALDLASEAALLDGLAKLSPRPAIVLVAHRPDSLVRCDRVFRVEAGRVLARSE